MILEKIIKQAVEVGAKYISDDGIEFDNKWECEKHETELKRKEKERQYDKAYASVTSEQISLNSTGDFHETYLKTFKTKEEFLETIEALNAHLQGLDSRAFVDGKYSKDNLPNFPAAFIVDYHYKGYENSCDAETFIFTEVEGYIETLQSDIDTIRKGLLI